MSLEIAIISNTIAYEKDFRRLNEAWISTCFQLEESDIELLNNPQKFILDKGGVIFIALLDGQVVGCCALIVHEHFTCELAKLAVDPNFQGQGIGLLLASTLIKKAKQLSFKNIFLEGSTKLPASISLYRKLGFKEIIDEKSSDCICHKRCNVLMEYIITSSPVDCLG